MHYLPGLANKLIIWYENNKRDLPWRHTTDPYKIWISEIIMQQTRVRQGLPYYERFTSSFPEVKDLANAPLESILRLWQGLGYYSRARNMHEASKQIMENMGGIFPNSFSELLKLKGVGRYTAAAIASFAYDEKVPVVDGNVLRVFTRLFGISENVALPSTLKLIETIASEHISSLNPGIFNQAIMEFGATYCIPGKPECVNCIFMHSCFAFNHNLVSKLPVKINQVKVRQRFFHYIVFRHQNRLALKQRTNKDIWEGLFEYYLIEKDQLVSKDDLQKELSFQFKEKIVFNSISQIHIHILSHQKIFAQFYECFLQSPSEAENLGLKFYSEEEVYNLPKPVLILKNINKDFFIDL